MTYKMPTNEQLERLERIDAGLNALGCTDEDIDREESFLKERDALPDPIGDFLTFAKNRTQKELGSLLIDLYGRLIENWEGYTATQITGIRKLLADLMIGYEINTKDDPEHYNSDKYYFFTGSHFLTKDMKGK